MTGIEPAPAHWRYAESRSEVLRAAITLHPPSITLLQIYTIFVKNKRNPPENLLSSQIIPIFAQLSCAKLLTLGNSSKLDGSCLIAALPSVNKVLTEFFDLLTDQKKPRQGVAFICVHSPVRQQRKGRRETVQGRGATSSGSDEESVCY